MTIEIKFTKHRNYHYLVEIDNKLAVSIFPRRRLSHDDGECCQKQTDGVCCHMLPLWQWPVRTAWSRPVCHTLPPEADQNILTVASCSCVSSDLPVVMQREGIFPKYIPLGTLFSSDDSSSFRIISSHQILSIPIPSLVLNCVCSVEKS